MDDAAKKTVLSCFPYGLFAVTVKHGGDEHGMTANWVTQASFEPPMVAVAVENGSKTIAMIRDAHHFAVNVFQHGQRDLAGKLRPLSGPTKEKVQRIYTKTTTRTSHPTL